MTENATQYVYGGDLNGKLWRFDMTTGGSVQLAEFAGGSPSKNQPIVRRPELGEVTVGSVKSKWIFVGTGKALTETDIDTTLAGNTATDRQSFYAVRDDLTTTYTGSFRSVGGVVPMDLQGSPTAREIHYVPAGTSARGWYFDFDVQDGERVNTDITLQVGWLTFGTRAPNPIAGVCDRKVQGFQYFVEYNPQSTRTSKPWETTWIGSAAATGVTVLQTATGETVVSVTDQEGNIKIIENQGDDGSGIVRRVSWRELVK
jgi:type IV pilus assembly protein PilY1